MQYYWINDHEGTVKDEQSPFIFPSCSQTLAHLQWWKAQKKKTIRKRKRIYKDQQNYKTLQSPDILQKLHVSYSFDVYCMEQTLFIIFILRKLIKRKYFIIYFSLNAL